MPDVTTPTPPPLVDLHNVELIHVGSWPASTGQWDVTLDDLNQAVAALDCPSIRKPIIKIGHTDPRFDGEPAIGWIDNLHVEGDQILVGDYRGLPGWLAAKDSAGNSVLASAWPDRSIEGEYGHRCQLGHTHPFVLTAVALLGVAAPAVGPLESLQDVASLFGVDAAAGEGQLVRATIRAKKDDDGDDAQEHTGAMIALIPTTADAQRLATVAGRSSMPKPTTVAAAVSTEDVRRGYYEQADWSKWITEIHLDPLQLIVVDDDTGKHYRIPVTVSGEDTFTFGEPVEVVVRYVDTATEPVTATRATVYATRAESRPDKPTATAATEQPAAEPGQPTLEDDMPLSEFRSRLGLPDDADEAAVLAAIDDLRQTATTTTEPVAAAEDVDERVKAATTQWREEARRLSEQLAEVRAAQAKDVERRAADNKRLFFDGVVATGRLKPAEREEWEGRYDRAPEVTQEILSARAAGSEVPVTPVGQSGNTELAGDADAEFDRLFAPTGASK
jgi:hypothetical protein